MAQEHCVICRGPEGDEELRRIEVWQDELWRLTSSLTAPVPGFSYLEPKRHIPSIADLDGEEAKVFGHVLARVARSLREAAAAEAVYIYVFGTGISHLHLHLAPHREGDGLNSQMLRGEVTTEKLPSGAVRSASEEFPPLPERELRRVMERVRALIDAE